jgi:hypothetical protein
MPKQFRDPKLRSADLAIRLITTTAEHLHDCPRCYEILVRAAGEKLEERIANLPVEHRPEGSPHGHMQDRMILVPSKLWPLLADLYPQFVRCEGWQNLDTVLIFKLGLPDADDTHLRFRATPARAV